MYNNCFKVFLFFLILTFNSKSNAGESEIEIFTRTYVDASASNDREALESLFYDAWDKCKFQKHNDSMKLHFLNIISEANFRSGYKYELLPIIISPGQEKENLAIFLGVPNVEYYPINPSHELRITQRIENSSIAYGHPVKKIKNKWYFVHACAGEGMDEYLKRISEYEQDSFEFNMEGLVE